MDLNNTAIFTSSCVVYVAVSMWTESRIARHRNREQPLREQPLGEQPLGEQLVGEQLVGEQRPPERRGGDQPSGEHRPHREGNAA